MIDEEEYFRMIEDYFLQKRGNPMLLSPKEWVLIREWFEASIPAEVVIRGIDRAFEKKKDPDNEITSLLYCKRIVKSEYKRHLKSMEGSDTSPASSEPPPADIEQFLEKLAIGLAESETKAVEAGNEGLAAMLKLRENELRNQILDPFRANPTMDRQRVEERLTGIEKNMEQLLLQMVPATDLDHYKEDSMRELKAFEEKLEFGVYQEMLRRSLIKTIRKKYNIPRLSLFYM